MKILSAAAEFFHADGQTDRHDKANGHFLQFANASKKWTQIHRVSQKEWTKLRESAPYVKIYRYNPKHLVNNLSSWRWARYCSKHVEDYNV